MFGYHKKLLRVDLANRKIEVEDLDDRVIQNFLGGVGIEAKILYEETTPDTDPLSPENILMADPEEDWGESHESTSPFGNASERLLCVSRVE